MTITLLTGCAAHLNWRAAIYRKSVVKKIHVVHIADRHPITQP